MVLLICTLLNCDEIISSVRLEKTVNCKIGERFSWKYLIKIGKILNVILSLHPMQQGKYYPSIVI